MKIQMKKLVPISTKKIPLAERMANNLDLGIEDPMYAEEAIVPKNILKQTSAELRRLSTLEQQESITLWVSEAVIEFLEDRSMTTLLTQLYKTKGESRPIAITLRKESK
jgi:hypothetical protein